MPWTRSVALWLALMAAESIHGTLRTLYLAPAIGDAAARRVSVLTGTILIFLLTLVAVRWLRARSAAVLLGIGALWVALTVLFEVALGRAVLGYDWPRILGDYDLARGGLMGFGLVAMFVTPLLAARIRGEPLQPPAA